MSGRKLFKTTTTIGKGESPFFFCFWKLDLYIKANSFQVYHSIKNFSGSNFTTVNFLIKCPFFFSSSLGYLDTLDEETRYGSVRNTHPECRRLSYSCIRV